MSAFLLLTSLGKAPRQSMSSGLCGGAYFKREAILDAGTKCHRSAKLCYATDQKAERFGSNGDWPTIG